MDLFVPHQTAVEWYVLTVAAQPLALWVHLFGFLFSPMTTMRHFFKNKRKQSPDPSPQETSPGILTDIVVRPVSYQAQSSIGEGGQIRSNQDPGVDRPDLSVPLDHRSSEDLRIVFQDSMDEDQEFPAPAASMSGAMIGGTGNRNSRSSECFWSLLLGPAFMWILYLPP